VYLNRNLKNYLQKGANIRVVSNCPATQIR
jgi:hypothetical protein